MSNHSHPHSRSPRPLGRRPRLVAKTRRADGTPRIVVTGVGVVSPVGIGRVAFWDGLCNGLGGIHAAARPVGVSEEDFGVSGRLIAEVTDFDPNTHLAGRRKHFKTMSRDVQLGVLAADLAAEDAVLSAGAVNPDRIGVVYGAGRIAPGPLALVEGVAACMRADGTFNPDIWGELGLPSVPPLWLLRQLPNMPACHVSIALDARGPNNTLTCQDASAILALEEAARTIARGAADVMIAGASSSNTDAFDLAKMRSAGELSAQTNDPEHALRPFDARRDGTVAGEGAAVFVLERYDHAVRRGADIYCELLGAASASGGKRIDQGAGIVNAMKSALHRGGIEKASGIGHINAHGKSTQWDDLIESRAYHTLLGDDLAGVPVTALKSHFGHTDAGSGAIELAGSVLALRHRQLPMTLGFETPDPLCGIDVVHGGPLSLKGTSAVSVNATKTGQAAAAVLQAV
ncbi:beta-ketoacyl-[acyl-carrier-protein] synthase family protein [Alienimonas californiensis]|uniref:3-oxoacyl-[acyl-carrier-protein] synthase 2 n=1 Tax=Alienimonas californiensis TaxID=2527989 RepID=A0A517PAI1_9PLAN|nr:beta-ketoacyl-[acyl-carrier-protein] synthase family protein [Alienimonas californiensis]QDT16376.1 3-oxoacyl-[acyl-carrier-protein] synthase 2 [Alienimonas californiensis]